MDTSDEGVEQPNRRRLLTGAGIGAAGLAGGVIGAIGANALRGDLDDQQLSLDVACDGATYRQTLFADRPDPGDLRGSPFSVQGFIYEAGTIKDDGFIPTEDGSLGIWMCTGFLIVHPGRPEPHVVTTQTYFFGGIGGEAVFPEDTLVSHGLEGANEVGVATNRPVTGGTGIYLGANGRVRQEVTGFNTSLLFGTEFPASNFRFDFDVRYLR